MTHSKQAQACFFDYLRRVYGLFALALLLVLPACDSGSSSESTPSNGPDQDQVHEISGPIMGTRYAVKWAGKPFPSAKDIVHAELERINALMSTYDPNSELSVFNSSPVGEWFPVSPDTLATLKVASEVNQASEGALDVTVGSLVNLWGFGPKGRITHEPSQAAIDKARESAGFDKLELDFEQSRIRKTTDIYVDLSAVAKGYAVDVIADLMEQHGIGDYLVDIGGELRMAGHKPDGSQWRIAIETPKVDAREIFQVLSFVKAGIATSGDYRNYFEENGRRYSHTIDPRSGRPIQHTLVSASVVADRSAVADAWATALMAVGPEKAKTLAKSHNLAVLLIMKTKDGFETWTSPTFEALQSTQSSDSTSDKH